MPEFDEEIDELSHQAELKHKHWWRFCEAIDDEFDGGFETIQAVEKYASENPEIRICTCDDKVFCGSDIALIPHPNMGITVVYIPQCSGNSAQFFLYPQHLRALINELTELENEYFPHQRSIS